MVNLKQYVDNFDGFPSLSETVSRIIDLFNKGDVDINVLEKALQKDPNLSIQVLKLANSPFFGISGEVTSIKDACMIMGLTNVFNLVTAADIINSLSECKANSLSPSGFWEHSISTAISVTVILKLTKNEDTNAFLVGLLHDIGKLALDTCQPEVFQEILSNQQENNCSLLVAEKSVLGFTHAQLGAEIARHWNLNENLCDAILNHHSKEHIVSSQVISALHIANFIVKGLELGEVNGNHISEFHSRSLTNLGLGQRDLLFLMQQIEDSCKENSLLEFVH